MGFFSRLFSKINKYTLAPRAINENWTRRMPVKYLVGYSTDHSPLTRLLLNYTFRDAQIVSDLRTQPQSQGLNEDIGNMMQSVQDRAFVEGFPYDANTGNLFEKETNGINLFIDFKVREGQQRENELIGLNTKTGEFFPVDGAQQSTESLGRFFYFVYF